MFEENLKNISSIVGEQSEVRLQIVLNALPIAISWASLEDTHILFMNRKFTEMFGYVLDDFKTVPEWVDKTYPNAEQRANAEASWYKYFSNPTEQEFEIDPVEVDVLCKDGTVKTTIIGGVILPEAGWALATFVDISERKQDELLIKKLAEQDPLTGLANRRTFEAYLTHNIKESMLENTSMHLLVLDLDHFKQMNDILGHQAGDQVLIEVANRLKQCVRTGDIVARFGGDEFVIILPNSGTDANVTRISSKIVRAIEEPINLHEETINISVSIGISRFPEDGPDERKLFAAADKALYNTKRVSRGNWTMYEYRE
jgi:diguanylate cyclase (GGDEF)-like protein